MPITNLENLLLSFDLCLSRRGWHIMCVTHRTDSKMIEWRIIHHLPLKFPREPPKEETWLAMPVPKRASTVSLITVLNCCKILWIATILIPPPHGLPTKVMTQTCHMICMELRLESFLPKQSIQKFGSKGNLTKSYPTQHALPHRACTNDRNPKSNGTTNHTAFLFFACRSCKHLKVKMP